MAARTVWTIGYEGHDPDSFVRRLRAADIQRVVDIRELPLSRKAGFSKSALAMGLSRSGIAYSHVKALGTPRAVRHAYKAGGGFQAFKADYLAHVARQEPAVKALEEVARGERSALLCVEAEAETCHRAILGEVLAARGWRVEHL
jgi:uncharacterized protein (DUF488 family)